MKRYAIIIESGNVKGQDDLPGARLDLRNWVRFLKSELGGAWEESEIWPVNKPTSAEVRTKLQEHADDYIFVAFSGHGEQRGDMVYVCLNDSEQNVSETIFTPNLGTVVLDCCRGSDNGRSGRIVEAKAMDSSTATFSLMNSCSVQDGLRRIKRCNRRTLFLNAIKNNPFSKVVRMYSCSKGQGAEEDPNAGGLYTSMLIGEAKSWGKSIHSCNHDKIYTTLDAHNSVVSELKKIGSQQLPEYQPVWQEYPFAIR